MLGAITVCKNRGGQRLINCINSVINFVDEFIVIDYGSDKPIKRGVDTPESDKVKIIRYDKNPVFNKSHAYNIGIKESKSDFLMLIDSDIIVTPEVMASVSRFLNRDTIIINTNVKRLSEDGNFYEWYEGGNKIYLQSKHTVNGGMPVFPRSWLEKVRGFDEAYIFWGAEDNDIIYRAQLDKMKIVDLNTPIFHQEHGRDENLSEEEKNKLMFIKLEKVNYMWEKMSKNKIINEGSWGEEEPNQYRFLKYWYEDKAVQKEKLKNLKKHLNKLKGESNLPTKWQTMEITQTRRLKEIDQEF